MGYQYWKYDKLDALCNDAFQKFGFSAEEAKIISDVLLMSDRIGIESHGMQRMYRYYKSIQKGMIHPENKGAVVFETPPFPMLLTARTVWVRSSVTRPWKWPLKRQRQPVSVW